MRQSIAKLGFVREENDMGRSIRVGALCAAVALAACQVTSHETRRADFGKPADSAALLAVIDEPGPLELETVASADWVIDRSGLINLDHPSAKQAGLEDGDEPIQIYFHVIRHPARGTFIVDTGVEQALRDHPDDSAVGSLVASAMHLDRMRIHAPLGEWLRRHEAKLAGVFLTHLHADHIMGLPDVPAETPIYMGPGEAAQRALLNAFVQSMTNRELEGKGPLNELHFAKDASGRFAGVIDLFGDGSLWAIHTPGHTPGSLAFVARTTTGPVLLTGDTSHTAWGWEHEVEPGSFTGDHAQNAASLHALRRLQKEHPKLAVRLGHQALSSAAH